MTRPGPALCDEAFIALHGFLRSHYTRPAMEGPRAGMAYTCPQLDMDRIWLSGNDSQAGTSGNRVKATAPRRCHVSSSRPAAERA